MTSVSDDSQARIPGPTLVDDKLWVITEPTGFGQYDFTFEDHFSCRHPYQVPGEISAVARMGATQDYRKRYDLLAEHGIRLIHSPEEYYRTSILTNWYPLISELTPRSTWFDELPTVSEIESEFRYPVFLKGERQTHKHGRFQSIIECRDQLTEVLNT